MRLLDLFCGAGGAAVGYHRAGFDEIVGVDIKPQPRYPFTFVQGDALVYVAAHGCEFDAIHASPPCQAYTRLAFKRPELRANYPMLVDAMRELLAVTGRPWVIENVPDADLRNAMILCGASFGLRVYRHRAFESSVFLMNMPHHKHRERIKAPGAGGRMAVYVGNPAHMMTVAGHMFSARAGRIAMGIDWMTRDELAEAIPPAYTEFIGSQLIAAIERQAA